MVQQFADINKAVDKCCELALQQPIPNEQISLMTDASFGAAGYVVLIEDDPNQKFTSMRKKIVCTGSLCFKLLHPSSDQDVHLCKRVSCNFLRIQRIWAYLEGCAEFGHHPN